MNVKLDINVSKCFTKAHHFETLISTFIQDKSVSSELFRFIQIFYFLLRGIAIKIFECSIHVCDVTILWIGSVSPL